MKTYTGNKPCPCCGETAEINPRASVDSVCYKCKDIYRYGLAAKEKAASISGEYYRCWIYAPTIADYNLLFKAYDSFFKLLKILDTPNVEVKMTVSLGSHHKENSVCVILRKDIFDQVKEYYNLINDAVRGAQAKGVSYGQSLLVQLANGDISQNRFDEYATRK